MSRRTDRVYSPTVRDRPAPESRRTERTERTDRAERIETVPRTQVERTLQEPSPRTTGPETPSALTAQRPGRTPNQEDAYPLPQGPRSSRTNEYFVPRDGIDREVVTADICRYLGNDALVRPGTYSNPQTRQSQEGYFITAYRNLTTEMIADLRTDSERWQTERNQMLQRGTARNAQYSASRTHESRQYYGPTTPAVSAEPLPSATMSNDNREDYDMGNYHYGSDPAASNYASTQGYPAERHADSAARGTYYGSASTFPAGSDTRGNYAIQTPTASAQGYTAQQADPRNVYYSSQTAASPAQAGYPSQQSDSRDAYYSNQAPVGTAQSGYPPSQQPADPYYGRAYGDPAPSDSYGNQYQAPNAYTQAAPTPSTSTSSGAVRRDRDRDDRDRPVDRHRRR